LPAAPASPPIRMDHRSASRSRSSSP
jgi:hypothetical protein